MIRNQIEANRLQIKRLNLAGRNWKGLAESFSAGANSTLALESAINYRPLLHPSPTINAAKRDVHGNVESPK